MDPSESHPNETPTEELSALPFASRDWEDPESIGAFRILEKIGEGGMGVVYLAEQSEPVRRRVALKIIKPGMDSKQVVARFEAERQALALMDHPNVARVFDAGTTERGLPYFVMEYVQGAPITKHCDRNRLSIEDRIGLFIDVCDAVQHAHQKGVIHRDLKPSNILVAYSGEKAVIKIIDFGVAKAVDHHLTEKTIFTRHGLLVGTPEYMSPEQAEMSEQGIDTRSDVYALGVVLYELLTGVLPFDAESLRSRGLEEIHRVIREVDPPKPSTRLSSITHESADSGAAVSKSRRTDIRSLSRRLRADLDWVVMRCLEKDRGRRYDTASELAADLKRFLQHEPVVAGPPTVGYRVKKFVRRHRVGVGTAGAVAAALVLGLAGVTWQWSRAELARERAQASEAQALELAGRLVGTFHDRVAPLPGALAVRDEFARLAIDHLERLRDRRGDDDRTILDIAEGYGRVGDVQAGRLLARRGDLAGAERSYERELALTREVRDARPSDDPEVLVALARARARLAATRQEQERQPEAADLCREAIVLLDRVPDPARDTRWRETRGWLGVRLAAAVAQAPTEARDPEERQRELTLAADLLRQVVVDSPSIHARLMLARALHGMAERLWERAQEEQNDALKAELRVRTLQRLADELAQLRSVVESVPAHVGARHDLAAAAYWNAILLRMDGRAQDALDATGEAERHLAFLAEAEPTDHQSRLESGRVEELRALTLRSLDRPAEALEATDRGLALIDALIVESPGHPEYRRVRIGLLEQRCRAAAKLGDSRLLNSAAQSMFREADRWDQAHPGDVDWTARRMALGAQFANAALGPLLAGPEGDALVVQTRLFVEDLDRALDRWRSQAAYEARAAALARARGDIAALLDDAG